jgi:prepilin-type N-terminal cleavage/methylation domain-containing protein
MMMRMITTARRMRFVRAVTLIEVMVAMVVLAIATLGALGYQYHAAKQAKIAKSQIAATQTAQLLLEDWKSTGGSVNYDPAGLNLGFVSSPSISADLSGRIGGLGTLLHNTAYSITVNDLPMQIVLCWRNIATDNLAEITLRQLSVAVGEEEQRQQDRQIHLGEIISPAPASSARYGLTEPVILTTYVRLDASSG